MRSEPDNQRYVTLCACKKCGHRWTEEHGEETWTARDCPCGGEGATVGIDGSLKGSRKNVWTEHGVALVIDERHKRQRFCRHCEAPVRRSEDAPDIWVHPVPNHGHRRQCLAGPKWLPSTASPIDAGVVLVIEERRCDQ